MSLPNIISGSLTASILDYFPPFLVAPNTFFQIFTLIPIIMKETCQDSIKKTLYLIISRLTGIIFSFHQTQALKNPITLSWKSLSLYLTLKLCLIPGLQISISMKNQFLSKFITLKDPCKKRKPTKDTTKTEITYQLY